MVELEDLSEQNNASMIREAKMLPSREIHRGSRNRIWKYLQVQQSEF